MRRDVDKAVELTWWKTRGITVGFFCRKSLFHEKPLGEARPMAGMGLENKDKREYSFPQPTKSQLLRISMWIFFQVLDDTEFYYSESLFTW